MSARSKVATGFACASLTLVAGCGSGSSPRSTVVAPAAAVTPSPAVSAHHLFHSAWATTPHLLRHVHWHIHVHRHVQVGVPRTNSANAPHFDTPEAAMRYAAAAWNAHDVADLRHVTDPAARAGLHTMRPEAIRLSLTRCTHQPAGDYYCSFTHEYPNANVERHEETDGDGIGHAYFVAAPADGPGWYMTGFGGCGG
ncbi:MAG TPA: hypothetical protein VHD81_10455 [Mycobacteriales bacterium]|nr:hypothetical protein [Mycobacteriales bacterium]